MDARGMSESGELSVTDVVTVAGTTPEEAVRLAGALAAAWSTPHPILRALAAAAELVIASTTTGPAPAIGADGVVVGSAEVHDLRTENPPGTGIGGVVRTAHSGLQLGQRVLVGSESWLATEGAGPPAAALARAVAAAETGGGTAVLVAWNGSARAAITLRPGS